MTSKVGISHKLSVMHGRTASGAGSGGSGQISGSLTVGRKGRARLGNAGREAHKWIYDDHGQQFLM